MVTYPPQRAPLALVAFLTCVLLCPESARATTWVVEWDGSGDATQIQDAIDGASSGDTVLVEAGTWSYADTLFATGRFDATYDDWGTAMIVLMSGVDVVSEDGASVTTLDAEGEGRVVFGGGLSAATDLVGFTVKRGLAWAASGNARFGGGLAFDESDLTITNCVVTEDSAVGSGAVHLQHSSADLDGCTFTDCATSGSSAGVSFQVGSSGDVTDCTFSNNRAHGVSGGAGCVYGGASPSFEGCTFSGNKVEPGSAGRAGGVFDVEGGATFTGCTFSNNVSGDEGGALRFRMPSGFPQVASCTFQSNSAGGDGGAIYIGDGGSSVTISNCKFHDNEADDEGGAIYSEDNASPTISGCTFDSNTATSGGGLAAHNAPTVSSCTFWGNSATDGHAIYLDESASLAIQQTIIEYHGSGDPIECAGSAVVDTIFCCDVYDTVGGSWVGCIAGHDSVDGNFSFDPLLCSPTQNKFQLATGSPCLPGKHPYDADCGLIGAWGLCLGQGPSGAPGGPGAVAGNVEERTWGSVKADYSPPASSPPGNTTPAEDER